MKLRERSIIRHVVRLLLVREKKLGFLGALMGDIPDLALNTGEILPFFR
jgi:hypothetical protein